VKIHNIYSDILLSLTNFLSNSILSKAGLKIHQFQYNLGNTSFQLKLTPLYKLPSAIVRFESADAWNGVRNPYEHLHKVKKNIHKFPVLYNKTKDIEIELQETLNSVNVSILINCESQSQALDFEYTIKDFMPLNAYIQAYTFTSFIELEPSIFTPWFFDTTKDEILNLFFKHDKYNDEMVYCFSIVYEPIIRLTQCSVEIGSTMDTAYTIMLGFEMITQLPSYIEYPDIKKYIQQPITIGPLLLPNISFLELCLRDASSDYYEKLFIPLPEDGIEFEYIFRETHKVIITAPVIEILNYYEIKFVERFTAISALLVTYSDKGRIEGEFISGEITDMIIVNNSYMTFYFNGDLLGVDTNKQILVEYSHTFKRIIYDKPIISIDPNIYQILCNNILNPDYTPISGYPVISDYKVTPKDYITLPDNPTVCILKYYSKICKKWVALPVPVCIDSNNQLSLVVHDQTITGYYDSQLKRFIFECIRIPIVNNSIYICGFTIPVTVDSENKQIVVILDTIYYVDDTGTFVEICDPIDGAIVEVTGKPGFKGEYIKRINIDFTKSGIQPITVSFEPLNYRYNLIIERLENVVENITTVQFDMKINEDIIINTISDWRISIPNLNFILSANSNSEIKIITFTDKIITFTANTNIYKKYLRNVSSENTLILSLRSFTNG
jgi:hypothetical protein